MPWAPSASAAASRPGRPFCKLLVDLTAKQPTVFSAALDWHIRIGAGAVSVAVASLLVAAACLAYRYERNHINGPWSDSYVLRQKLNSLLTLFFVGSALLVITNVALNSAMGWSGALLGVISDATSADSAKEQAPATGTANTPANDERVVRPQGSL